MYMLRVIFYNIACGYIVLFSSNIANIWYIASCLRRVFRIYAAYQAGIRYHIRSSPVITYIILRAPETECLLKLVPLVEKKSLTTDQDEYFLGHT